jgi:hypothetical protein
MFFHNGAGGIAEIRGGIQKSPVQVEEHCGIFGGAHRISWEKYKKAGSAKAGKTGINAKRFRLQGHYNGFQEGRKGKGEPGGREILSG